MKPKASGERLPVKISRNFPKPELVPFTEHFQGFEKVGAVRKVFGDETDEVLASLRVGFIPNRGMYMGIRDNDGNIAVGTYHLKNSPLRTIYLDIVHELFHINQRRTRPKWFHEEFMKFMGDRGLYYASPIEIPAYEHTVREAERIGMTEEEILEYLKIGEPPERVWRSFVKHMGLGRAPSVKPVTDFRVKVKRKVKPNLVPFTDFFRGFERVDAVQDLFGDSTGKVLAGLRVEFIDSPFQSIYPSDEDGHLIVSSRYMKKGTTRSLFLDAFLALNIVKAFSEAEEAADEGEDVWESPGFLKSYQAMVKEARRLGASDEEILTHMQLPSFMMEKATYRKLLKSLGLKES